MIELPLVALSGILGSSHCLGMCGGFALSLGGSSPTWRTNLLRQTAFGLGRIFTYASLGAAAGYGGRRLVEATTLFDSQAALAVFAGLLLLAQGIHSAGVVTWIRRRWKIWRSASAARTIETASLKIGGVGAPKCGRSGMLGSLLTAPGVLSPMLAGVMTGLLPCGLVYAMLALAVCADGPVGGALTMACFGLGTLPVMTALGLGTSLLGFAMRRHMLRMAAWCVVVVGCMSVVRGAMAWSHASSAADQGARSASAASSSAAPPPCPFCPSAPTQ